MSEPNELCAKIRAVYAERQEAARKHAVLGRLTPEDIIGIQKRTAQLCGVTMAQVKEVCGG